MPTSDGPGMLLELYSSTRSRDASRQPDGAVHGHADEL